VAHLPERLQVLLAGGESTGLNPTMSAELYDPSTGTFTSTGSLATARAISLSARIFEIAHPIGEAALLSGLIPAPSRYEPRANELLAEQRRKTVLQKMYEDSGRFTVDVTEDVPHLRTAGFARR
jgi:hypothetical protein